MPTPVRTSFAVAITTRGGLRRYLGPARRNSRSSWRRRRNKAYLVDTFDVASRLARSEALSSALAVSTAVYRVDEITDQRGRPRHRWHLEQSWDARAVGGAVPYGEDTAMMAQIRPAGQHRHVGGGR